MAGSEHATGAAQKHLANLKKVGKTIESQIATGLPKDDVLNSQFRAWSKRFANLPEDDDLTDAFSEEVAKGPWTAKMKVELGRVLMERGGGASVEGKAAEDAPRRPMQKCENFENFLTQKDWASIRRDGVIKAFVISVIGARSDKLGIINPSERTLNRMVRITAFCLKQYEWGTGDVRECKTLIRAAIKSYENPSQRKIQKKTFQILHLKVPNEKCIHIVLHHVLLLHRDVSTI